MENEGLDTGCVALLVTTMQDLSNDQLTAFGKSAPSPMVTPTGFTPLLELE